MKITLILVSSLDGKITKNFNPKITEWTSNEDQQHFQKKMSESDLIIMGRKTYEAARPVIKLSSNQLRVVITNNPKKFKNEEVKEQLEFTNENPKELVKRLGNRYKRILHVGGGAAANSFMKEGLITDILLTLEPKIFGRGTSSGGNDLIDENFKLNSVKKLNAKGTLLLHYSK